MQRKALLWALLNMVMSNQVLTGLFKDPRNPVHAMLGLALFKNIFPLERMGVYFPFQTWQLCNTVIAYLSFWNK